MSRADVFDLIGALKRQFGVRGDYQPDLGGTILPVVQIADFDGEAAPLGIPWSVTVNSPAVAGQRSEIMISSFLGVSQPLGYDLRVDKARVHSQGAANTYVAVGVGGPAQIPGVTVAMILDTARWRDGTDAGQGLGIARAGAQTNAIIVSYSSAFWELEADGAEWTGHVWLKGKFRGASDQGTHFVLYNDTDNVALRASISGVAFPAP